MNTSNSNELSGGLSPGDTMDIGTTDKIGLANAIPSTSWVYKIKKNNANYPAASYTPEAVYDTVDLSTGGAITGGDDFTVWYMS